jgi:hypothetical protein
MSPTAAISPALPIESIQTLAGLICGHGECRVLSSNLDDSISHANEFHGGDLVVNTCDIQEHTNAAGEIELVLVSESQPACKLLPPNPHLADD